MTTKVAPRFELECVVERRIFVGLIQDTHHGNMEDTEMIMALSDMKRMLQLTMHQKAATFNGSCQVKVLVFEEMPVVDIVFDKCERPPGGDCPPEPASLANFTSQCEAFSSWLVAGVNHALLFLARVSTTGPMFCALRAFLHYHVAMSGLGKPEDDPRICAVLAKYSHLLSQIPPSYHRYAQYMSTVATGLLSPLKTSAQLHSISFYSFPASLQPSQSISSSDSTDPDPREVNPLCLFWSISCNRPHHGDWDTEICVIPRGAQQSSISFDNFPLFLHGDVTIACHFTHSSSPGESSNNRNILFSIKFHTCQVVGEHLTFCREDLDQLHKDCPADMKIDLYFQSHIPAKFKKYDANYRSLCLKDLKQQSAASTANSLDTVSEW